MSDHVTVKGMKEFQLLLKRHITKKQRQFDSGIRKAVRKGANTVKKNSPKAFGDLRESIDAVGNKIVIDAPHAQAIEVGSRPHWVSLENLKRWVELRLDQALKLKNNITKGVHRTPARIGTTTHRQAAHVLSQVRRHEGTGVTYDQAIRSVAAAIQKSILKNGTLPQWYVKGSLPQLHRELAEIMVQARDMSIG